MEITATIDGKVKVVTEASVRRHLKLEDFDGISIFPTTEIFNELALMGEQFNSNIATALTCLATNRTFSFSKMIFDDMVKNLDIESHHTSTYVSSTSPPHLSSVPWSSIRHKTEVPQPSSPTHTLVADKAASTGVHVRHRGAATTVTSLDAGQGSGNIDKTPFMPHDSPLPRVNILGSDDGSMQHNELMDLVIKLSDIVLALETNLKQTKKEVDLEDPSKHGRKIEEIDQDPDISLIQHDADIQERYEKDMEFDFDVAKEVSTDEQVLTAGAVVTTTSVDISLTSSTRRVSTTDDITMAETLVYIRRSAAKRKDKGKGIIEESESAMTKAKRQQEQERLGHKAAVRLQEEFGEEERQRIARVHEAAQTFTEEDWGNNRARVKDDEELTQRLQAEEKRKYSEVDQARCLLILSIKEKNILLKKAEERGKSP
nr:hypothetical protein [Tanacetum cinerariifolium]